LQDGDVWFLNLPEVGGNHLPDVKAIRPVFADGRLLAFAINLAHWADIGGAVPGSYVPWATECYQEGVRISPVRLFSAAGPDREKLDFLLSNIRGRDEREGDVFAQYAANDIAARRLGELVARYGADTLEACFDALHAASEAQMRAALRALPDGVWEGEDWLDDDGRPHLRRPRAGGRTLDHSLRGPRGRRGRQRRPGRRLGHPCPHVQRHEHADGGHRGRVPVPHRGAQPAPRLGG